MIRLVVTMVLCLSCLVGCIGQKKYFADRSKNYRDVKIAHALQIPEGVEVKPKSHFYSVPKMTLNDSQDDNNILPPDY